MVETVHFAPGEVSQPHRHNADLFVYVLEGSIVTQLKGGSPQTVHAGEVSYESPTDVHSVSRNASKDAAREAARLLRESEGCSANSASERGGRANEPCPHWPLRPPSGSRSPPDKRLQLTPNSSSQSIHGTVLAVVPRLRVGGQRCWAQLNRMSVRRQSGGLA